MEESILSTTDDPSINDDEGSIADSEYELPDIPQYDDRDDDIENAPQETGEQKELGETSSVKKRKRVRTDSGPSRRSKRLADKPSTRQKMEDYGLVKGERLWKEFEKKLFLDACKVYGSKEGDKIAAKVPTKTADMVKSLIRREKQNQNYTIETRYVEADTGESIVLDDGETGRRKKPRQEMIDLPDATPQGKIVETLKRRARSAPIEMWIDATEKKVIAEERKQRGEEVKIPTDYSTIVPSMLQVSSQTDSYLEPFLLCILTSTSVK